LFIERELAAIPDWTVESLVARREKLVDWARERWQVDAIPRQRGPSPKTIEEMIELAEQFDLGEELQAIHNAASRLRMWPTIRKGIQYRNPYNYRLSTIVVYLDAGGMTIYFYTQSFGIYPGVTGIEAAEILGVNDGWNRFPRERISEAIEALERFYDRVKDSLNITSQT
jgi:hypothetical protein